MATATAYSLAELVACAERELKIRLRVYPGRVMAGRMSQREADRQIEMMAAIAGRLREVAEREREQLLLV
ncbi:MAG TPA: hypothetical protein VFR19_25380 [Hyphomicrobiaceae bacterium]|jgi:hypothetical protein|nr:hypothetical protein [Hyphomicrobiaceae bacterium]